MPVASSLTLIKKEASFLPLYVTRGLVKHKTRWRSISSEDTYLEHTGHLNPDNNREVNIATVNDRWEVEWEETVKKQN